MSGLSQIPPLPPFQPSWPDFQVWWQLAKQEIEAEIGAAAAAAAAAADAAAAASDAAAANANAITALADAATADANAATAQTTADSKAKVTRASSAPGSPATNDVWVDSSTTPAVTNTWNGSAWVVAATEGADLASNVSNANLDNVSNSATRRALANNAVATADVQNHAITNPTSAYSTGSISVPATGTWADIQTVAITATGAPINIDAFFYAGVGEFSGAFVTDGQYRIVRDSTVIFGPVNVGSYNNGSIRGTGPNGAVILDQPASGSRTYKLQAFLDTTGTVLTPIYRSLVIMEAKK